MYVHTLHTVHALPDLRVAGGRLGDSVSPDTSREQIPIQFLALNGQKRTLEKRRNGVTLDRLQSDQRRLRSTFAEIKSLESFHLFELIDQSPFLLGTGHVPDQCLSVCFSQA